MPSCESQNEHDEECSAISMDVVFFIIFRLLSGQYKCQDVEKATLTVDNRHARKDRALKVSTCVHCTILSQIHGLHVLLIQHAVCKLHDQDFRGHW